NDGMLHAFTADQSAGGQELYAFVPNGVFGNLINLTKPDYNGNHEFFVDGTPTAGDVQFSNGTWNTILVGGLRNGGKSIYALNITNPPTSTSVTESQIANNVLWEFTDSDMGQTYSRPMIGRLHDSTSSASTPQFVAVFGSGYNNSSQTPYLYFVNAQTGALVDKMDLCSQESSACDPSLPNGLSSPALLAPNGDGIVTTVYVGDLQGNLWKVDISNASPSKWSASVLFKAEGPSNQPQPITTAPVVSLHPLYPAKQGYMVYFGTGKYLGQQDVPNGTTTPQTQTVYGVWDQPTNGTSSTWLTRSNLQAQTLTSGTYTDSATGAQTNVLLATTNSVNWNTQSGWYMDLDVPPGGGARVIKDPSLDGGRLKFTFYVPPGSSSDSCNAPGQSYLMTLNYANGGAFPAPEFDLNNDGTLNSADQVGVPSGSQYSGNPVGVGLGQGMSSGVIEMSGKPTKSADSGTKLIGMSSGNIVTVHERGGSLAGRMSWRQLK
ncbi:MAG: PilC/PilY family type IV pilus protein, partial [Gammaproteobacteria bacterium]